jgi:hypothetical protein
MGGGNRSRLILFMGGLRSGKIESELLHAGLGRGEALEQGKVLLCLGKLACKGG